MGETKYNGHGLKITKKLSAILGGIQLLQMLFEREKESNQPPLFINVEIHVLCIDGLWLNDPPLQL